MEVFIKATYALGVESCSCISSSWVYMHTQ